jgi:hypothetical protein
MINQKKFIEIFIEKLHQNWLRDRPSVFFNKYLLYFTTINTIKIKINLELKNKISKII